MKLTIQSFLGASRTTNASAPPCGCIDPPAGELVTAYCFGDLPASERSRVDAHLMDCDNCWATVKRLAPAVEILRANRGIIPSVRSVDVCAALGISSRLDSWLGGHGAFAVLAAFLNACIFASCLLAEVSYAFDRLGQTAIWVGGATFTWVAVTSIAAVAVDWKLTRRGSHSGLFASILIFVGATIVACIGVCAFLPDTPVTQMDIPAQTARGAYLKDIAEYTVPLVLILLAIPFHFVLSLQKEFQDGRYAENMALLSRDRKAVAPEGAIHLRPAVLCVMLFLAFLISIHLTNTLFAQLKPGPYKGLFTVWIYFRWTAYFGLGLICVLWYGHIMNKLKRECLTAEEVRF